MSDSSAFLKIFDEIFSLLNCDLDFRREFFENPEIALRNKSISLSDSELTFIKNTRFIKEENVKRDFQDGLVLCSSSGF